MSKQPITDANIRTAQIMTYGQNNGLTPDDIEACRVAANFEAITSNLSMLDLFERQVTISIARQKQNAQT